MLDRIGLPGLSHLLIFGVLLPIGAWRSRVRLEAHPLPPKTPYFASVVIQQLVFGLVSMLVARALDIELFPRYRPTVGHGALALVLVIALVTVMRPEWRRKVEARDRRVYLVTPLDATDRVLWVAICVSAGVLEEVTYRGVLFWVGSQLTGSIIVGALISAVAFGVGHAVQGWKAAGLVTLLGLGFQSIVIATGTLYVAMTVHIAYDLIAGWTYAKLARELGYPTEPIPPEGTASAPEGATQ